MPSAVTSPVIRLSQTFPALLFFFPCFSEGSFDTSCVSALITSARSSSPAPGVFAYTNFGVTEAGLFTPETFTLPEGSKNFVMIVEGASDDVVKHHPRSYHEALDKNGVEHVYYITEGGHEFKVWRHGLYNFAKHIFQDK